MDEPAHSRALSPRQGLAITLMLGGLFALTTLAAPWGADSERYLHWARAFWTGNVFALESETISTTGVPLSQWSHGPGLIAALAVWPMGRLSLKAMGLLFALGTFVLFARTLLVAARGRAADALVLLAVALTGTHLGFYSVVHSSESLSFLPIAGMTWWICSRRQVRLPDAFALGAFAYLLVITRVQLVIYCGPVAVWLLWTLLSDPEYGAGRRLRLVLALALVGLPVVLALLQVGAVNAFMTGSPLASPYSFRGEGFSSFDPRHPELGAILAHPWHGLLAYHPAYAIAFAALVAAAWRAPTWKWRATLWAFVAAMLLHLYLQASWYAWWLGLGSFGMRGLSMWFIPAIPALAPLLRTRLRAPLLAALLLCCVWSFLLLAQTVSTAVYSQHYTAGALLRAQLASLWALARGGAPAAAALAVVATLVVDRRAGRQEILTRAAANALLCLYLFYLVDLDLHRLALLRRHALLHAVWLVPTALLLPRLTAALQRHLDGTAAPFAGRTPRAATAVLGTLVVVTSLVFGVGLARMRVRGAHASATPAYAYRSTFQVEEIKASYDEYVQVPGFEGRKQALKTFVERLVHDSRVR
jgi:hypothetical protein